MYILSLSVARANLRGGIQKLPENFDVLGKYKMRLYLAKYGLGLSSKNFICFMVNEKGIEINP